MFAWKQGPLRAIELCSKELHDVLSEVPIIFHFAFYFTVRYRFVSDSPQKFSPKMISKMI